jgi:UDP-N-acetyl-D-mannosaminuronic acid transferase (WecB/TagA/CpsF family)
MDRDLAHGLRKRVGIRPFIRSSALADLATTRALQEQLGIDEQMHMVQVAANMQDGASARPNEVVTAILGNAAMVIRTGLGRYVGDALVYDRAPAIVPTTESGDP